MWKCLFGSIVKRNFDELNRGHFQNKNAFNVHFLIFGVDLEFDDAGCDFENQYNTRAEIPRLEIVHAAAGTLTIIKVLANQQNSCPPIQH